VVELIFFAYENIGPGDDVLRADRDEIGRRAHAHDVELACGLGLGGSDSAGEKTD
jgi:hypothetical protein